MLVLTLIVAAIVTAIVGIGAVLLLRSRPARRGRGGDAWRDGGMAGGVDGGVGSWSSPDPGSAGGGDDFSGGGGDFGGGGASGGWDNGGGDGGSGGDGGGGGGDGD